jgi:hypothetical protein
MPYFNKIRQKWVGEIEFQRKRYRELFDTKQNAKDWEVGKRKELLAPARKPDPQDMELRIFFSLYLDHAEFRFSRKTFLEKQSLLRALSERWGGDTPVGDIKQSMVEKYLV